MKTLTVINLKNVRELNTELNKYLKDFSKKYSVDVSVKLKTFSNDMIYGNIVMALSSKEFDDVDNANLLYARNLKKFDKDFDVSFKNLNEIITIPRGTYKFIGLSITRRKYPYVLQNVDTNKILLYTDAIIKYLKKY